MIDRPKSIGQAWRKLIQQQKEIERLRAVVTRYAGHDAGCTCEDLMDSGVIFYRHDWPCSCGYLEALAALEGDDE